MEGIWRTFDFRGGSDPEWIPTKLAASAVVGLRKDAARSLNDGLSEARCAAFMQQLLYGTRT